MNKRRYSEHEMLQRRFHADVRRLKAVCKTNKFELSRYDLSKPDWICILSSSDYELESEMIDCDEHNENYFLSPEDYQNYRERYGYE